MLYAYNTKEKRSRTIEGSINREIGECGAQLPFSELASFVSRTAGQMFGRSVCGHMLVCDTNQLITAKCFAATLAVDVL